MFAVLLIAFVAIQFWKSENATVPPRIMKQRSVAAASWFAAALAACYYVFVYYLPIWFQAIKGASAIESGTMNIPSILSLVIVSMLVGALISWLGYLTPFMIISSVLMSISAGLFCLFDPDTGAGEWIGYQIFFGAGCGFGMQLPLLVVQTVLPEADIAIGTAVIMFTQTLGGSLFISVAQNVFTNQLLSNVKSIVPGLDPNVVLSAGATTLQDVIPTQFLEGVKLAYNDSVISTYYVGVGMGCVSLLGAVFVEWKSVKGKKLDGGAAA